MVILLMAETGTKRNPFTIRLQNGVIEYTLQRTTVTLANLVVIGNASIDDSTNHMIVTMDASISI